MRTPTLSSAPIHPLPWLTMLIGLAAGACTSSGSSRPDSEHRNTTVLDIVDDLLQSAERRVSVRQVRLHLRDIHPLPHAPSESNDAHSAAHPENPVGPELEHRFLIALSSRFPTVEPEFFQADLVRSSSSDRKDSGAEFDATHVVVGDYEYFQDELTVGLRLVDVETHLIVAAARGTVPLDDLSDQAISYLRTPPTGAGRTTELNLALVSPARASGIGAELSSPDTVDNPTMVSELALEADEVMTFEEWLAKTRSANHSPGTPDHAAEPDLPLPPVQKMTAPMGPAAYRLEAARRAREKAKAVTPETP